MGTKRRSRDESAALRKRDYRLREAIETGVIQISVWSLPDPPKTYDADACWVLATKREIVATFGQTLPGVSKVLNAVSIGIPRANIASLIEDFKDIRERLDRLKFEDEEIESCRIEKEQLNELTSHSFARFSAQIIRASTSDEAAVVDFYQKPITSTSLARAQPNRKLEVPAVIRVTCSALVLSAFLSMLARELYKD